MIAIALPFLGWPISIVVNLKLASPHDSWRSRDGGGGVDMVRPGRYAAVVAYALGSPKSWQRGIINRERRCCPVSISLPPFPPLLASKWVCDGYM